MGYGGAILAAVGCGEFESVAKYEKQYQKFKHIYPAVKDLFHMMSKD